MSRTARAYLLGLFLWAVSFIIALKTGAVYNPDHSIVFQLRLPRAILSTAIGMGLSVSGATLQALFSNPLCEPYTLGISSGAALGAVLGISLGLEWTFIGVSLSSFLGAVSFAFILYVLSTRRSADNTILLLAGVMLGLVGSSLVALWMTFSDPKGVQAAVTWLMGDLYHSRLQGSVLSLAFSLVLCMALWCNWQKLDAFLMGEESAKALGVSVKRVRGFLIFLVSLLVAVCVSSAGSIGFIGLIIPHWVRKMTGSMHFQLIPLCAIWGAAALTLADALARWVARPYEIPVGVITALIGAPLFLWIMLNRRQTA